MIKRRLLLPPLDLLLSLYVLFALSLFFTDYHFIFSFLRSRFGWPLSEISNVSIHVPVAVTLLFLRWLILPGSFSGLFPVRASVRLWRLPDRNILFLMSFLLFLALFLVGTARHYSFSSSGIDMGVTMQALWNTFHYKVFFSSLDGYINHLGAHFEPILLFIAPLYHLAPGALTLLFVQSLVLSLAVFPLYLIARKQLSSRLLVLSFVLAYVLSRPLRGVGLFDFHSDAFFIPLIFCAYYCLIERKTFRALVCMALSLACKEDGALLCVALGSYAIFAQRRFVLGGFIISVSVAFWFAVTEKIMPFFAVSSGYPYRFFLPFGQTYQQNITAVLSDRSLLAGIIFGPGRGEYYLRLFAPLGLLPLFGYQTLSMLVFPMAEQLFVGGIKSAMLDVNAHYSAHTLPFIFISAVCGAGNIVRFIDKKWKKGGEAGIFMSVLVVLLSVAFFGKSDAYKFGKFIRGARDLRSGRLIACLKNIPESSSVSAVHYVVPHLANRRYIYIWDGIEKYAFDTEYVVFHPLLSWRSHSEADTADTRRILLSHGYAEECSIPEDGFYVFRNPKMNGVLSGDKKTGIIPFSR